MLSKHKSQTWSAYSPLASYSRSKQVPDILQVHAVGWLAGPMLLRGVHWHARLQRLLHFFAQVILVHAYQQGYLLQSMSGMNDRVWDGGPEDMHWANQAQFMLQGIYMGYIAGRQHTKTYLPPPHSPSPHSASLSSPCYAVCMHVEHSHPA